MFFTVRLSNDERVLTYRMNPLLRVVFLFFLVSLAAMFLFDFSAPDFYEASLPGKINMFLLPFIMLLGSSYTFTIRLDKTLETISIIKGFYPITSRKTIPLSSLSAVVKQRVHSGVPKESAGHFLARERYIFGFIIDGKMILIDRAARKKQIEILFGAFRAFFPFRYEIL